MKNIKILFVFLTVLLLLSGCKRLEDDNFSKSDFGGAYHQESDNSSSELDDKSTPVKSDMSNSEWSSGEATNNVETSTQKSDSLDVNENAQKDNSDKNQNSNNDDSKHENNPSISYEDNSGWSSGWN